jgi:uncharacterized membrane protein
MEDLIERSGNVVVNAGVLLMVGGSLAATVLFAGRVLRSSTPWDSAYSRYRKDLGQAILLGLEVLVIGDIVETVAFDPTAESVAVLAGIVLIRTFLSFSIDIELEGRWPWARERGSPNR